MFAEVRMPQHADPDGGGCKKTWSPVIGNGFQYFPDIRYHQNVGSTQPKDGVQEHVPLGAVIDGKGVHVDVGRVVAAVDDAAHVLGHKGLVADDYALGQRFRSAGVSHLAGVFDAEQGVGLRGRVGFIPILEFLEPTVRGSCSGHVVRPDQRLDGGHFP